MHRQIIILVLVALVAGCASGKRSDALQATLDTYGAAMRWNNFQGAVGMIHPDERPEPAQLNFMIQRFDQIRVTGYRVVSTTAGADPDTVIQQTQLSFSNRHTAHERSIRDRQIWKWHEEEQRWWLMSGLPDISRVGN